MPKWSSTLCADAGTEYCPCYLAEVGRCVNCSLLSEGSKCECEWTGICIYAEFNFNSKASRLPRSEFQASVAAKTTVGRSTIVLSLAVPRFMAKQLRSPGSFLFLKPASRPHFFDVPLSVMQVSEDNSQVHFAVQIVGAKTHALDQEREAFVARGPFFTGLLGLSNIKMPADEVLIVAKGVSQGRAVHTACYLARRGANVTMATGPGPVRAIFAPDFLDEPNVMVTELPMKPDHSRQDIADLMSSQKWDLIMSAGPDIQHRMISTLASEFAPEARLAYTNNALMCCGEGICGACETAIGESQVRVCKGMPDTEMITF